MKRLALVLTIVLAGCRTIDGPGEPLEFSDGIEYFEEGLFRPLWDELETCSKLNGNLRSVSFYYVSRETLPTALPGVRTVGMYFPRSNRIFIVSAELHNPKVIRHEMMHALLRDNSGHPPQYFSSTGLCGYV